MGLPKGIQGRKVSFTLHEWVDVRGFSLLIGSMGLVYGSYMNG